MNAVETEVKDLIFKELNSANEHYPLFRSPHEGYAVIKEEVEEAMDAMNLILEMFATGWANIKVNSSALVHFREVKKLAGHLAVEAIQVAAMCEKYDMSLAGTNPSCSSENRCVMCGVIIPEGRMVCPSCSGMGEERNGSDAR